MLDRNNAYHEDTYLSTVPYARANHSEPIGHRVNAVLGEAQLGQ
jgi:hypothetical protein